MKRLLLTAFISTLACSFSFAQDSATNKSIEDVPANVVEVPGSEIKKLDSPTYAIPKTDGSIGSNDNETKEVFREEKAIKPAITTIQYSGNLYSKGVRDASTYYDGSEGAEMGTLVVSILSPVVGLIPAIACSMATPNEANLNYPNSELMKNPEYYKGYTRRAKKIKGGKVWTNWAIGFGANIVAGFVIASLL